MDAISVLKETKYACNLKFEMDHICLQSFSIGAKYACNNQNSVFARFVQKSKSRDFITNFDIAGIFGPY